jgi:hypothetical protein
MKKVSIKESDLKKIIHESLGKQLFESSVPKNVLDFVQQNPKIVIEKLMESHGENFFDLVGETYSNKKNII